MSITYFTSAIPGDLNHRNQHAKVDDIEFVALPYQAFYVRVGDHSALVDKSVLGTRWNAFAYTCLPNGESIMEDYQGFDKKDQAFKWAASRLKELEASSVK